MAVVLPPLAGEGGDEQPVWLGVWVRIALELIPAEMDIFLAKRSFFPCAACLLEIQPHRREPPPLSRFSFSRMLNPGALDAMECQADPIINSTSHLKSLLPPSLAEPLPGCPSPVLTPCNPVPPPSPSRLCLLSASRKWSGSNGPRSRCFGFGVA